jgi:transposase
VNEAYDGKQFVGIDLHRRRSVVARIAETGEPLGWVQIINDRDQLALAMAEAGEDAEVVLEATYGWYWAADLLAGLGAKVHLAHPLGVKAFSYRRVKNDVRDATDLADLLRMGRLPEAWIAPPETRELWELVRHRAKLVHLRTSLRCQVHAVLAGQGVPVSVSDLFGVAGNQLLDELVLPEAYRHRVDSLRRLIELFDVEIDAVARLTRERLSKDPGYVAVQTIPGVGPILGAAATVAMLRPRRA